MRNQEILLHLWQTLNNESYSNYDDGLDNQRIANLNLMENNLQIKEEEIKDCVFLDNPEIQDDPLMVKEEILELDDQNTIDLELKKNDFQIKTDGYVINMGNSTNLPIKIDEQRQVCNCGKRFC